MTKEELSAKIAIKNGELIAKKHELERFKYDLDPEDYTEGHDEYLDEIYPEVSIGGCTYSPSEVWKYVDPIAYRQSLLYYVDNLDESTMEGYSDLEEEIEELDEEVTDLENELEELEEADEE